MLIPEVLLILLALPILIVAILVYLRESFRSPIHGPNVLTLGAFLLTVGVFCYLITALSFAPNTSTQFGTDVYKLGSLLYFIGEAFIISSFILPTFTVSYTSIFENIFNFVLFISVGLINYFTVTITVDNDILDIHQSLITFFGIVVTLLFVMLTMRKRYIMIKSVIERSEKIQKTIYKRFYFEFIILLVVYFLFVAVRIFKIHVLPAQGMLYLIPASLLFLLTAFNFKYVRMWFVTSSELFAVIIAEKNSGIEMFSKLFLPLENKNFISSFLKATNVTTQQIINSNKSFEIMAFSDKVILAVEGDLIVTFVICSDWNVTTYSLTKYVTKTFEKIFSKELLAYEEQNLLNKKDYESFDEIIEHVRNYIPL